MKLTQINKCRWTGSILVAAAVFGILGDIEENRFNADTLTGAAICSALGAWQLIETGESKKKRSIDETTSA